MPALHVFVIYCCDCSVFYNNLLLNLQVCLAHGVIVLVRDDFSCLRQELSL